ncbi:MAG TPA: DUF2953 domain-containing protein [Methanosarcina sp.]|nr:DUF2953 domain-containing protein [Methanosarcina sp.]
MTKKSPDGESEKPKTEERIKDKDSEKDLEIIQKKEEVLKTQDKIEQERKKEIEEKTYVERTKKVEKEKPEEKGIQKIERKEKRGILDRIRGEKKVRAEDEKETEKWMSNRQMLQWGIKAFQSLRKPLFRLFSDLLNGIKIKRLESCITFGLSDPADTGMLCGFIHSIIGLIYSRCKHCSFSVNPVFMDPVLHLQGNAEIRVRIYSLIFPVIKFMFNRKTLSFTYSFVKEILRGKLRFSFKKQEVPSSKA